MLNLPPAPPQSFMPYEGPSTRINQTDLTNPDAYRAFQDLCHGFKKCNKYQEITLELMDTLRRYVLEYPELVFTVDKKERSLLKLCMDTYSAQTKVDSVYMEEWHDIIKWLISKNRWALIWKSDCPSCTLELDFLRSIPTGIPERDALVRWIYRKHGGVFCHLPQLTLLWYHLRGFTPASFVKRYIEMNPDALDEVPMVKSVLHRFLEEGGYAIGCSKLFKWIAKKKPEAMLVGCAEQHQTLLHIACEKLSGDIDSISPSSSAELKDICLFLISEHPEWVFVKDRDGKSPLAYFVHFLSCQKVDV
jgi:hypothetical protein